MPIINRQQVTATPQTEVDYLGRALYQSCMNHFLEFAGQPDLSYGYDSCNAAVAIQPNPNYDAVEQVPLVQQGFSVLYGTSRLFRGLDPDYNARFPAGIAPTRPFASAARDEHAEQTCINLASSLNLAFFSHNGACHIYIDFTPCPTCEGWLQGRHESWFVHYGAPLNARHPITAAKKRNRQDAFGTIFATKRRRLDNS